MATDGDGRTAQLKPQGASAARSVLGAGAIYTLATAAPVIATLLVTPFVTRTLGAAEYGIVGVGIATSQIMIVILGLGLPAAITRHAIIEGSGARGATALVLYGTGGSVVLCGAAAIASPIWGPFINPGATEAALVWPIVLAAALAVLSFVQALLRALGRAVLFVTLAAVAAIAPPALGLLSLIWVEARGIVYLQVLACCQVLIAFVSVIMVVRVMPPIWSPPDLARGLRVGLPTVPHQLAMVAATSCMVIIAARELGTAAGGRMQIAVLIGTAPLVVLGALNNSWAPTVYRTAPEHREDVLRVTTRAVAAVSLALCGGTALLAPLLLMVIAPPEFAGESTGQVVAVICTAAPLMVVYLANIHLVFVSGRTGLLAISTPLAFAVGLSASLVFSLMTSGLQLWSIALILPVFYLAQLLLATALRRRASAIAVRLKGALPVVALGVLICVIASTVPMELSVRLILATAVVVGALLLTVRTFHETGNSRGAAL